MIRIVTVDDHPAVRLGLESALDTQPDLVPVGSVAHPEELPPLLYRTRPDVVLLDYHLPRQDGLSVCWQIKQDVLAPAVVLYSAYADASIVVPAIIAGADGIVPKDVSPTELFGAIRAAAEGGSAVPPLAPEHLEAAADALDVEDRPILDMLFNRVPRREIARALHQDSDALNRRITNMLQRLKKPIGLPAG